MIKWKKSLNEKISAVTIELEKLKYSSSMLKKKDLFYQELKESFDLQLREKEKIDHLNNDPMIYE